MQNIILRFLTVVLFIALLLGCGKIINEVYGSGVEKSNVAAPVTSKTRDVSKTAIVYFSCSGNTEQIAKWIHEYTQATIIRIDAQVPYPKDYGKRVERGEAEHHQNARPVLATDLSQLNKYDTIILGWPCWNYSCPMLILTMLEQYDFSGKTIIPFTTSDVSGFAHSLEEMKKASPNADFENPGLEIKAQDIASSQKTVNEWLSSLGFTKQEQ